MSSYQYEPSLRYAVTTHEWARQEDSQVVVGISDAAQDMMSDIVFVELPEIGTTVAAGDAVAVVESVKAAEDIIATRFRLGLRRQRRIEPTRPNW